MAKPADDDEWQLPWQVKGAWRLENGRLVGRSDDDATQVRANEATAISGGSKGWLQFRNWRWSGGTQFVEVPLVSDEAAADWERSCTAPAASWIECVALNRCSADTTKAGNSRLVRLFSCSITD